MVTGQKIITTTSKYHQALLVFRYSVGMTDSRRWSLCTLLKPLWSILLLFNQMCNCRVAIKPGHTHTLVVFQHRQIVFQLWRRCLQYSVNACDTSCLDNFGSVKEGRSQDDFVDSKLRSFFKFLFFEKRLCSSEKLCLHSSYLLSLFLFNTVSEDTKQY